MGNSNFFRESGILFPTNKCNNKCIICQDAFLGGGVERVRGFEELKRDVDFFISNGKKSIQIYGGEPFLNPNMEAIIDYISQFDLECCFNSNARVFSDKSIVERIKKLKRASVQTSLFSYREDTHDYITNTPGSYRQAVSGIKNLVEEGVPVGATIVLTGKNTGDLEKTVEFLDKLGVTHIKVSGLIIQGRMLERPDLVPSFAEVKKAIGEFLLFAERKELKIRFEKLPPCVAPQKSSMFIYEPQHKEKMVTCPLDRKKCIECDFNKKCMCF